MDPVLDRVRAADPADPHEFAGRGDFDSLLARLEPPKPRRRRRLLALPALSGVVAALVLVPGSAPQASEILEKASAAVEVDDGILYAHSQTQFGPTGGKPARSAARRVWVRGDTAMRWLQDSGDEEVFVAGEGTTHRDPQGRVKTAPDVQMVPTEVFRARALLQSAQRDTDVKLDGEATVNGRAAYVLRWNEESGPPHWPTIEMTMWVDKETYAPLRFTDHSHGTAADGTPFDQTYVEDVIEFKRLPDTPENRKLLELSEKR